MVLNLWSFIQVVKLDNALGKNNRCKTTGCHGLLISDDEVFETNMGVVDDYDNIYPNGFVYKP
jgi:hypothetical protein